MLVRNTEQFGCGLVMIGGPNSFGAGGWTNTELEKAMPVDFQIKNAKVKAVGALVMMMHACEMAQGNHWQKVIVRGSPEGARPQRLLRLLHWDDFTGGDDWLWTDQQRARASSRVQRPAEVVAGQDRAACSPATCPQFEPAMQNGPERADPEPGLDQAHDHHQRRRSLAAQRHDPQPIQEEQHHAFRPSPSARTARPSSTPLQNIATSTGGKYYVVNNPKALPRIFQIEARRVARPLIKEDAKGIPLVVDGPGARNAAKRRRYPARHRLRADARRRKTRWSRC